MGERIAARTQGTSQAAEAVVPRVRQGRGYISFHGGEGKQDWNNLHAFSSHGEPLGKVLATHDLPDGVAPRELRGFAFGPDGDLYVANAYKGSSQILRFGGERDERDCHPFRAGFAEHHHTNPGLAHPFHVAFGPDDRLYVVHRAAGAVNAYDRDTGRRLRVYAGHPLKTPVHLLAWPEEDLLLVGDRDATSVVALDPTSGSAVTRVAANMGGLETPAGLAWGPDWLLYVADQSGRRVLRFDPATGLPAGPPPVRDLPDGPEFIACVDG